MVEAEPVAQKLAQRVEHAGVVEQRTDGRVPTEKVLEELAAVAVAQRSGRI